MSKSKKALVSTLLALAATCTLNASAQQTQDDGAEQGNNPDNLGVRVKRQHTRIDKALRLGVINQDQAKQLSDKVDEIANDIQERRQANGGELKPEDFKQIENSLNQSSSQIQTTAESGQRTVQSGNVLGPNWQKGPDGAQNAGSLIKKMKAENRREMRQEHQTNAQKIEQQQLQYEREMVEHMGEQRENILKQKDDLKDVRKESGAD